MWGLTSFLKEPHALASALPATHQTESRWTALMGYGAKLMAGGAAHISMQAGPLGDAALQIQKQAVAVAQPATRPTTRFQFK